MKKHTALFLLFSLSMGVAFILINCAENSGAGPNGNNGSSGTGFNPRGGGEFAGFTPVGISSQTSTDSSDENSENSNSVSLSADVLDLEERHGVSAQLTIVDDDAFEDYRLGNPINSMDDIEDLRVYVKLKKTGDNRYGGKVTVAYWDYSDDRPFFKSVFTSGSKEDSNYNIWMAKDKYHGFFQDEKGYGSLIFIIDGETAVVQNPDATQTNTLYSGSIWTMQFRTTFGGANSCNNHDQSYVYDYNEITTGERLQTLAERKKKCWQIDKGPFDCRTWRVGGIVETWRTLEPDDCYAKLATFKGLDIVKAFGVNKLSDLPYR